MNMYKKLYRRGEVRETIFADILLFCGTWPMFLGGKNDKRTECEVKDKKSYEESDRKSLSERGVPEHMVVVEDTEGLWLLEGYDCYTDCKSLVEKGLLPAVWGVYNLKHIGRLSWEMKVGLGLHAGLKRTLARNHGVSKVRLLRAVWHLNSGRKGEHAVVEQVKALNEVFQDNDMDVKSTLVLNIVETAGKLGCVMGEFIEGHADDLEEKLSILGGRVFQENWWTETFTRQYNREWWYRETPIVQVLLLFFVVVFEMDRNTSVGAQPNLRLQIIKILRQCATLITKVSRGRWGFLLKSERENGDALQKGNTMFHMVGFAITNIIERSVDDLVDRKGRELYGIRLQDALELEIGPMDETYLPTGEKLPEAKLEETMGQCLSKVLEVLHEHGYVRTRNMIKQEELR